MMESLGHMVLATGLGGVLSVLVAAMLTVQVLGRMVRHLVSFSTGILLGTALLNILPEAFESHVPPQALFGVVLGGLLFFFLLEKAELYRHGHHHEGDDHHHHHGFDRAQAGRGGWSVLVGDSTHNFCDGMIIATAFMTDVRLGWATALAIIAHEIPQEVGDFIVLLNAGFSRSKALVFNALSGLAAVLGGLTAYGALGWWSGAVGLQPYLLAFAASSFLYVAVADLIPQLQHPLPLRGTLAQIAWLALGLGLAAVVSVMAHGHAG